MSQDNPTSVRIGIPQLLVGVLAAILAVWLNMPAFHPFHLEAYSMSLLCMATDLLHGGVGAMYDRDPDMGLVTQYIYLTRPLCVWLLAGAVGLVGPDGAWPALMVLGWAGTLVGSMVSARKRGVNAAWSFTALVFCQGFTSAASSWNETLLWAGFCAVAAAALPRPQSGKVYWRHGIAGSLIACAAMCRQDGLLGGVLVACMIAGEAASLRQFTAAGSAAFAGFAIMLAALSGCMGIDIMQALRVAHLFTNLREQAGAVFYPETILITVGFPMLPLVVWGILGEWRTLAGIMRLLAGVLIWLVSVWIASNPRYVLPALIPLLAFWGGTGAKRFADLIMGEKWAFGLLACSLLAWSLLCPPAFPNSSDGPNVLLGRAVEVKSWLAWQKSMRQGTKTIERLVDGIQSGQTVIITAHYEDDAALRLGVTRRGWHTTARWHGCPWATAYADGMEREILHVRTVAFYGVAGPGRDLDALMSTPLLVCPDLPHGRIMLTSSGAGTYYSAPSLWGDELSKWMLNNPLLKGMDITRAQFEHIREGLTRMASHARTKNGEPMHLDDLMNAYHPLQ